MATYSAQSLGIKAPRGGFQQGGWYGGRQYWNGTLSEVNAIHPESNQQGAGQQVSQEVVAQSAAQQGVSTQQMNQYLDQQRQIQAKTNPIPATPAPANTTSVATPSAGTPTGLPAMTTAPTLNLQEMYKGLFDNSGITGLEQELASKEKAFAEAKAKIRDNPYLSEGTIGGRISKIEALHADNTKALRDQIATKRADIETQLNIATKQFDINSTAAKNALDQFNTLLSSGALDNASGESIASLTQATGINSDMIYSAIQARKEKNQETQVITSTNDAGVVTISVIDPKTGAVIKQNSLGAVGNAQTGAKPTAQEKTAELQSQFITALENTKNSYGHVSPQDWQGALASWISRGGSRDDFIKNFQQYADPNRGDFDQVYFQR